MQIDFGWPPQQLGPTALALGSFDGVHLGHQRLLAALVATARANREVPAVITFDPHPRCVLDPANCPPQITTLEEKMELIARIGIEQVMVVNFTREFAAQSPEEFMAQLDRVCQLRRLVVGPDFRFGRERSGDLAWLRERGRRAEVVEGMRLQGQEIHSSEVRRLVTLGEMAGAARLLGRRFALFGMVKRGDQIGRQLGFPTANLTLPPTKLIPGRGIYAGWASHPAGQAMAAISIGYRPTFGGTEMRVEAFLLDYSEDLYDRSLELRFVARLRDEEKFDSQDDLIEAIGRDVDATRELLGRSTT
ncbi:MAG TPA: bifunctional riboflavin kinase/FAD synthetase [Candidatus Acidoferrales bacterium]|nr:bifunctional riboflavin kinase/FAD synthetase [Candidatus Acidoferrales bacterium]